MRVNWGTGVALTYAVFASGTIGVVTFALGRPVVLVTPAYYAESLRQDERTAAVNNSRALGARLAIAQPEPRRVVVTIPAEQAPIARGSITFYRASDAAADRTWTLAPDPAGRQLLSVEGLAAGRWTIQLRWSADGRSYYFEKEVTLE